MRLVILFAWMLLASQPLFSQTEFPSTAKVKAATTDADYALRRFEEVSGRMNFSGWHGGACGSEKETREVLDAAILQVRQARGYIKQVDDTGRYNALLLLGIYSAISEATGKALKFAGDASLCMSDTALSRDFSTVFVAAYPASKKVLNVLVEQLVGEEGLIEELHKLLASCQPVERPKP